MLLASTLIDKWEGQITSPRYDAEGAELFSSRIRRAVQANAKQRDAEAKDPRLVEVRLKARAEAEAAERVERAKKAEERHWNGMEQALRSMGLADAELHAVAAMDLTWPAVAAVDAWMDGKKAFLLIGGDTGVGKTLAALRICLRSREMVRSESFEGWFWRPGWCRYVKAAELARFSYYDKGDKNWLERLGFTKFLILDDLGAEQMSDTWRATLLELIDTRMRNGVRTCITTNLNGRALKERYDARVMRRLSEVGEFVAAKKPEKTT